MEFDQFSSPTTEISMGKIELAKVLREKKFWMASLLVAWAAALQWNITWIQKQDAFKEKFGDHNSNLPEKDEEMTKDTLRS